MSNITFAILDSAVTKENQVFDRLIQVRRLDTQEEGLLLCSHCCKWPLGLISQATWLEGCFTPEEWKEESRLLTGYHPDHLVSWSIDWNKREVALSLVEQGGGGEDGGICFPIPYSPLYPDTKLYKYIDRYMRLVENRGDWQAYCRDIFSATVRLYQRGTVEITFVMGVPAWLMNQVSGGAVVHYTAGSWALSILYPFGSSREPYATGRVEGFEMDEEGQIQCGPCHLLPTQPTQVRVRQGNLTTTQVWETVGPWVRAENLP